MVRVLIADACDIVRLGIKHLCGEMGDFVVAGEARCVEEALDALVTTPFDLLVIDPGLPGRWHAVGGQEASLVGTIRSLCEHLPIIAFSGDCDPEAVRCMACKNGFGFLSKDCSRETFAIALRQVARGKNYISSDIAIQLMFGKTAEPLPGLRKLISARELQIMKLLAKGVGVNAIAGQLGISNRTVSTHKTRLMQKLNLRSNADLFYFAVGNGLIENGGLRLADMAVWPERIN